MSKIGRLRNALLQLIREHTQFCVNIAATNGQCGGFLHTCVNSYPVRIHWQSATVLVIEPADLRNIIHTELDVDVRIFVCGNSGEIA